MVQRGAVKLQYVAMDEKIANVLTKPLAKVNFEYFREKLGFSKSRFLPRGSNESVSPSDMVGGGDSHGQM